MIHFLNKGEVKNFTIWFFMLEKQPCLVETDGNGLFTMFSLLIFMLELGFVLFYDAWLGKVIFKQFKSILKLTYVLTEQESKD